MLKLSKDFLQKTVNVVIDRPMGSIHPKFKNIVYALNYGYVPDTVSGDGEDIDAYILGVDEPLEHFTGVCIAYLKRKTENDDKLIIAPAGVNFSDDEIWEKIKFQKQFFKSILFR